MTRKDVLMELLAYIAAEPNTVQPWVFQDAFNNFDHLNCSGEALSAYHGSIPDAVTVHEAVLPEWDAAIYLSGHAWVYIPTRGAPPSKQQEADSKLPSRALLIADIKALIEECEE